MPSSYPSGKFSLIALRTALSAARRSAGSAARYWATVEAVMLATIPAGLCGGQASYTASSLCLSSRRCWTAAVAFIILPLYRAERMGEEVSVGWRFPDKQPTFAALLAYVFPGRVSMKFSLGLAVVGIALVLLEANRRRRPRTGQSSILPGTRSPFRTKRSCIITKVYPTGAGLRRAGTSRNRTRRVVS